jgi:leucyl-tRNA synthetase
MTSYSSQKIETKWQKIWNDKKVFATHNESKKPKFYILDMFPYPSGHGLHVGHLKGYIASDVVARFKRMQGFNVLHPMGWDSFGLPTERQAERDGISPQAVTKRNIETFKEQLNLVGLSYDWTRELATSDLKFYRWTQWAFNLMFERGLAYESNVPVNWCPALCTVVANEEVFEGAYIETGDPVERKNMRQWLLRITSYAERLLNDLDGLDWPREVKELQRNWIGRSEGAIIKFSIKGFEDTFEVFSTRPETLFGCSFCVLAPEHPLVKNIVSQTQEKEVLNYIDLAVSRSERERMTSSDDKTGVFTGASAVNPVSGQEIQIWVADYVLMGYGTGAVFACPAHDQRDYEFAQKYNLDITFVVEGKASKYKAYTGKGSMIHSGFLDGEDTESAKKHIIQYLTENALGKGHVTYNLRDWLFSRQRYWGEPIPVIHGPNGEIEIDKNLPVILPSDPPKNSNSSKLGPGAPLAEKKEWVNTTLPGTSIPASRETNVMPQWAGSSWYYLRFIDPHNEKAPWSQFLEKHWMPVDLYVGGIEHANLHLLYARFWHKVLYDAGYVSTPEPFKKLFNQGKVESRSFRGKSGQYYYPHEVVKRDDEWYSKKGDGPLVTRIEKMSKSKYNVFSPNDIVAEHGADSLRLYEMFMGPVEQNNIWQAEGISGTTRFLEKVWRLYIETANQNLVKEDDGIIKLLHQTIRKVTEDIDRLRLNTAISQMMVFVNESIKNNAVTYETLNIFIRILAPFAPYICEEMWEGLGNDDLVLNAPWPEYDPELCVEEMIVIVLQVNGKLRDRVSMHPGASKNEIVEVALKNDSILRYVKDPSKIRSIYIQDKLLNLVT